MLKELNKELVVDLTYEPHPYFFAYMSSKSFDWGTMLEELHKELAVNLIYEPYPFFFAYMFGKSPDWGTFWWDVDHVSIYYY